MTTPSGDLLRLLEPTVRPGSLPGANAATPRPTFENSRFDQLLAEAKQAGETTTTADPSPPTNPLAALADPSRIDNATLRTLLANR